MLKPTGLISLAGTALCLASGCASYHGYPERYSDVTTSLIALQANFAQPQITECESGKTLDCRDLIVNSLVQAIDLQYDVFRQQLYRSSGALNLGADVVVLGLSGVGSLITAATTKSILAAVAGFVTGTKTSIDKNLLFDKTVLVLVDRMDAIRKERLLEIQKGLAKTTWAEYRLAAALVDVEAYYTAGTIPAAINSINAQTGDKVTKAEKGMQDLRK
jgi:hypothetical protein